MNNYYYFSRDTGWGDTLWHLTNALMYCEQNKKDILIDMRGHWASKGNKNLFGEYFQNIDTDIEVILNERCIDQYKKEAEPHSDSRLVIKNPLKSKEESKKFYDTFGRINVHGTIAAEIDEVREKYFQVIMWWVCMPEHQTEKFFPQKQETLTDFRERGML